MTDDRPDLTKTEARQGNSRKMNSRALILGLVGLVILFALVFWFSTATYDETETTTPAGTTVDETSAAGGDVDPSLEELPTPAPVEGDAAEEEPVATEDAAPAAEGTAPAN